MANYYFLAASLPLLVLGEKPDISFEELTSRFKINLNKEDYRKTVAFRRYIDVNNIRFLFLEESIDQRGNLNEKDLDEALLLKEVFPLTLFDFLDRFESISEKLKHFSGIFSVFFSEEIAKATGFLKAYFEFERSWKMVMLALRAKEQNRDIMRELQFENFSDPIVAQILAQKDGSTYDPPPEYIDLKETYVACGADPWEKYKVGAKWRLNRIEELVNKPVFSIDWILSYMARLLIVEDYYALDEAKGKMILDAFVS
jgi:hypothetical protein